MITHIITVSKDKEFKRYFTQKFDQKQQKQQKNNTIYTTTVKSIQTHDNKQYQNQPITQ